MKTKSTLSLLAGIILFAACETDGAYEINDKMVTVASKLEYMANADARYRIEFGNTVLADTLPWVISAEQGIIDYKSKPAYVKERELTQVMKIWRLDGEGSETLESETTVTATADGVISLLQLSDDSPLSYFEPVYPAEDKTSQTIAQFFYSEIEQPEQIAVTVLAVDYFALLLSGNNINNVAADKKTLVGEFTVSKGLLSTPITLDLDQYTGDNNGLAAQFFYKITDPATETILQNYLVNSKITVTPAANDPLHPKYKFTLFQWKYQSATVPFKAPIGLINGEEW